MRVTALIVAVCHCLTAVAQQTPPTLEVAQYDKSSVTPGFIYLAPNTVPLAGPYVYDSNGTIVFNGAGKLAGTVHSFQPCVYQKKPRFCAWQGNTAYGYGSGQSVILDDQFKVIKSLPGSDYHEFKIVQAVDVNGQYSDTAHITVYTPVRRDLSAFGVPNVDDQGWVVDCRFRAIDLATSKTVFEWSSLDHVDLSEGYVPPIGGISGYSQRNAWDYFHLNSVARLDGGDYLISSRHTSTVYRISGKDGSIIWRLGGKKSDFKLNGFSFDSQHDVRVVSGKGDLLTLSLFDNEYNTFVQPKGLSTGKTIELNTATKTARLVHQYDSPSKDIGNPSGDGGSVQVMPKGNAFIGWGSDAQVTEYTADGRLVYAARFGGSGSSANSYRAFKAPFTGIKK
ncbi:MAG: hypothetical protein Q9169_003878 [Polycauliona sp. 2 TL-2023]